MAVGSARVAATAEPVVRVEAPPTGTARRAVVLTGQDQAPYGMCRLPMLGNAAVGRYPH